MPCQARANRGVRVRLDRLDLTPQRGERAAPKLPKHVDVAPLALDAVRAELASDDAAVALERGESGHHTRHRYAEAGRRCVGEERPVARRVPGDQIVESMLGRSRADGGKTERDRGPEPVAQPAGIVRVREAVGATHAHGDGTPSRDELVDALLGIDLGSTSRRDVIEREIAEQPEQVVDLVDVASAASGRESLQIELEVGEHPGIDELAQLLRAHEIAKQIAVERQRRRSALRERRVVLVHVRSDPAEEEGLRERRRLGRLDRHHPDRPRSQIGQHRTQRRDVEHVLQTLTGGLEQHGEAGMLRRDGEQVCGALALLPQRGALAGTAARQEQGAGRALTEPRREERRRGESRDHEVIDLLGSDDQLFDREVVDGLGQPQHDAVVGPHHLDGNTEPLIETSSDRDRPRRVHSRAERRQDTDAPVADLVAEPLDDDRAIVGHRASGLGLLTDVAQHVVGCPLVEAEVVRQPRHGLVVRRRLGSRARRCRAPSRARADDRDGRRARRAASPAALARA